MTGGLALARKTGATYVVAGRDEVSFERCSVHDGDNLSAGNMTVRVLETPGHTDTHVSYVISDGEGPAAVFTGGSLLYGNVGRTDLLGEDRTDELTRKQWRSARRLAELLPDETPVYPTHGFGSFCSSGGASGGSDSTMLEVATELNARPSVGRSASDWNGRRGCRRQNSEAFQPVAATLGAHRAHLKPDVVDHGFGQALGDFVDERAPLFDRHLAQLGAEHDSSYECLQLLATLQPGWVWNKPHIDIGESGRPQVCSRLLDVGEVPDLGAVGSAYLPQGGTERLDVSVPTALRDELSTRA